MEKVKAWEEQLRQVAVEHAGELVVTFWSLLRLQVCARQDLSRERIVALTNQLQPTGTRPAWSIAEAPVVCAKNAAYRHWILEC